eukprot:gene3402-3892_t
MKRRLQDISNIEGPDEGELGRISPENRKRRVAMEKRRRDKINQYLDELSTLVPKAAEKMNVTKLEKAEVLEMTVDYVKGLKSQRIGELHKPRIDPEVERKRGFMTCMSHIKAYLENNQILSKSAEDQVQTNPTPFQDYDTSMLGLPGTMSPPPLSVGRQLQGTKSQDRLNVFNKICSDFLKNNSCAEARIDAPKQSTLHASLFQQQIELPNNISHYRNDSCYINNIDLGYGSFLSAINEA